MKKYILVISLLVTITILSSYSLYDKDLGSRVETYNAQRAGAGGAGVAGANAVLDGLINPANIINYEHQFGVQLGAGFVKTDETRNVGMYNFFDGLAGDAVYASNVNNVAEIGFGAISKSKFGKTLIAAAFYFHPLYNFDAAYEEEVRNNDDSDNDNTADNDNYPNIIAKNYLNSAGALNAYTVSIAAQHNFDLAYLESASLGLSFAKIVGGREYKKEIKWSEYANKKVGAGVLTNYLQEEEYDYSGTSFTLGTNLKINEDFYVGFAYTPQAEITKEDKMNDVADVDIKLPAQMKFGICVLTQNIAATRFNVDMVIAKWSDIDKRYDDVKIFRLGVEHIIAHRIPFRLGFRWESSPVDEELITPTFCIGSGWKINERISMDMSGEFANRKFSQADEFMDSYYDDSRYTGDNDSVLWKYPFKPKDRADWDKVEETFLTIKTSISYQW